MATKQNFVSNKEKKKQEVNAAPEKKPYVPIQKRLWCKILIVAMCFLMAGSSIIWLIWYFINEI